MHPRPAGTASVIWLVLGLSAPGTAARAQEPITPFGLPPSALRSVGAVAGSAAGLWVGNALWSSFAPEGGDASPAELLLFAGVPSSLGTAFGLGVGSDGALGPSESLTAAVVGMVVAGLVVAAAHEGSSVEGQWLLLGYALGQGVVAGAFTSLFGREGKR